MDNTERKFHWCLDKGKTGGRKHHGLRKIKPNTEDANNHIQKTLHNLEAVDHNIKGGFGDWAVSALSMRCIIHYWQSCSSLAMLSKNQECTINTIDYFIKTNKINFDSGYIAMIR